MTFVELFGSVEKIVVLDLLADHPRYSFTIEDIQDNICLTGVSPENAIGELLKAKMIKKTNEKYQLNIDNNIVKAMIQYDIERGKQIADEAAKEER